MVLLATFWGEEDPQFAQGLDGEGLFMSDVHIVEIRKFIKSTSMWWLDVELLQPNSGEVSFEIKGQESKTLLRGPIDDLPQMIDFLKTIYDIGKKGITPEERLEIK